MMKLTMAGPTFDAAGCDLIQYVRGPAPWVGLPQNGPPDDHEPKTPWVVLAEVQGSDYTGAWLWARGCALTEDVLDARRKRERAAEQEEREARHLAAEAAAEDRLKSLWSGIHHGGTVAPWGGLGKCSFNDLRLMTKAASLPHPSPRSRYGYAASLLRWAQDGER